MIFSFTSHYTKTPVSVVNNPIRSKIPWPNISPRPRQGTDKSDAYGER